MKNGIIQHDTMYLKDENYGYQEVESEKRGLKKWKKIMKELLSQVMVL